MSEAQVIHVSKETRERCGLDVGLYSLSPETPLAEHAGARCEECWWGAAGPWSHRASTEHALETGHRRFEYQGIEDALISVEEEEQNA